MLHWPWKKCTRGLNIPFSFTPCNFHPCSHRHTQLLCICLNVKCTVQHQSHFHYAWTSHTAYSVFLTSSGVRISKHPSSSANSTWLHRKAQNCHVSIMGTLCEVQMSSYWCSVMFLSSDVKCCCIWQEFLCLNSFRVRDGSTASAAALFLPRGHYSLSFQSPVICCAVKKGLCHFCPSNMTWWS